MFSKRQSSPYQPKIHLLIPFSRGSGSLQVQEICSYKKEKKKRTLTNVLRDNYRSTNPRFIYQFYFQENLRVFKSKRSIPIKKNINEYFQRDNYHFTNSRFTYWFPFQKDQIRSYKKERKENVNERSQRQPLLYQPKIYLSVLFSRESESLQI